MYIPRWSWVRAVRRPFFFFQAEDGIRDLTVTGVQTCALPIYPILVGFSGNLTSIFVVERRRCPKVEQHCRSAARNFDCCRGKVRYFPNDSKKDRKSVV